MKLNPSILISLLTGVDDGYVFSASKGQGGGYIQSVRTFVPAFNPNTQAQQDTRLAFKNARMQYDDATDKTIGGTSFVRTTEMEEPAAALQAKWRYYGVPSDGRQLAMAGMVREALPASPTMFSVLPQNMVIEANLIAYKSNLAASFVEADREQRDRIGFIK